MRTCRLSGPPAFSFSAARRSRSARRDLSEALARFRAHDGPTHPRTAEAERELATLDKTDRTFQKLQRIGPSPD